MDIHTQFEKALVKTAELVKTAHDTMKVVNEFLNTQYVLSCAKKKGFYMARAGSRTAQEELMFNKIRAEKIKKIKG